LGEGVVTPKKRGTRFEYRVAYIFQRFGYSWDRSGSSLGIDLKITKKGRLCYLVSCKKTSSSAVIYIPKEEIKMLRRASMETGAEGLVCFGFYRSPVLTVNVRDAKSLEGTEKYYRLHPEIGCPLEGLLKRRAQKGADP
jgi:Holliday junction resolvase